jgi:oxygen-dependent protoporphyrinogen oxidase
MPGPGGTFLETLLSVFKEPVLRWAPMACVREYFNPRRPGSVEDESVYDFITRRFGTPDAGDMTVSAVLHGIYAGDVMQLSARSLLPQFWFLEEQFGSIIKGLLHPGPGNSWMNQVDVDTHRELTPKIEASLYTRMSQETSVYSFKEGIGALPAALEKSLQANPKVQFRKGSYVKTLEYDDKSDKVNVWLLVSRYSCY